MSAPASSATSWPTPGRARPSLVTILASDIGEDATGQVQEPVPGTTKTAPDGTWTLTLLETLPADVQKAKDDAVC
ncbi:hypothetical protein [Streptomyces collinus]|uniref:hypothetical protein n=1 Tax=Streptomyces collinus TaxID=42684 RepID=UPI003317CA4C